MKEAIDLTERLKSVSHFQDMTEHQLEDMLRMGQIKRFRRNSIIFHEGEPCAGLFVLLSGQVQLSKVSLQGQFAILAIINPVIMFNEVAALDKGPNPVTATASEPTVIWRLEAPHLEDLMLRHPRVGLGLAKVLARRNRNLVDRYEDITFRSVLARSAKLILKLSDNGAIPIDRRKYPLRVLASLIGTVPEALSRSLKVFRQRGEISCTARSIHVLQADLLAEAAEIQ